MNNEDKTTLRRTKTNERPRSSPPPFPMVQIAEKYRKELRELNAGALHLPTHAQSDSKEDVDRPRAELETPQLKKTWNDEVEVVKDANGINELEKEQRTIFAETSEGEPFFISSGGLCVLEKTMMYIINSPKFKICQSVPVSTLS